MTAEQRAAEVDVLAGARVAWFMELLHAQNVEHLGDCPSKDGPSGKAECGACVIDDITAVLADPSRPIGGRRFPSVEADTEADARASLTRVEQVLGRFESEANCNFHHKTCTLRVVSDLRRAIKGAPAPQQAPAPHAEADRGRLTNACGECGHCYHPVVGPNTDGEPCEWCQDCGCHSGKHTRMTRADAHASTDHSARSRDAVAGMETWPVPSAGGPDV